MRNKKVEGVFFGFHNLKDDEWTNLIAAATVLLASADAISALSDGVLGSSDVLEIAFTQGLMNTLPLPNNADAVGGLQAIVMYLGELGQTATDLHGGSIWVRVSFECCECCYLFFTCWEEKEITHEYKRQGRRIKGRPTRADFKAARAEALKSKEVKCK